MKEKAYHILCVYVFSLSLSFLSHFPKKISNERLEAVLFCYWRWACQNCLVFLFMVSLWENGMLHIIQYHPRRAMQWHNNNRKCILIQFQVSFLWFSQRFVLYVCILHIYVSCVSCLVYTQSAQTIFICIGFDKCAEMKLKPTFLSYMLYKLNGAIIQKGSYDFWKSTLKERD